MTFSTRTTAILLVCAAILSGILYRFADAAEMSPILASGRITIEEAVLMALENNRALHVQRLEPEIRATFIDQERGVFDPMLSGEIRAGKERYEGTGFFGSRTSTTTGAEAGISGFLPTGTLLEADLSATRRENEEAEKIHEARLGMSVTQAILRGRGVAVNLASFRQASLDERMSRYELAGFTQSLVAEVETVYWEYVLARQEVQIVEQSLSLAGKQLEETRQRVRVGGIAETEMAAAKAEVALRKESLINAKSRVNRLKIRLLRLIAPYRHTSHDREILPESRPEIPPDPLEALSDHIETALHIRPDIQQAKILIERGALEIVKTKNGLLPEMNLFIRLGKTGYADSFSGAVKDMDGDSYDVLAGIGLSRGASRVQADARHRRSLLLRGQREISLENLKDLVCEDVSLAYIDVRRTLQQVHATETTRKFQEEKLRAESAKFAVGKSTALLVAQAQRDLLESQVSEVAAITNYLKARIHFYLMEGSLLQRRGIDYGV